jgi:hypothetical protein
VGQPSVSQEKEKEIYVRVCRVEQATVSIGDREKCPTHFIVCMTTGEVTGVVKF